MGGEGGGKDHFQNLVGRDAVKFRRFCDLLVGGTGWGCAHFFNR